MVKLEVGHLHRPKALEEANVFSKIGEDPQLQLSSSGDEAEKEEDISENQGEDEEEKEEGISENQVEDEEENEEDSGWLTSGLPRRWWRQGNQLQQQKDSRPPENIQLQFLSTK